MLDIDGERRRLWQAAASERSHAAGEPGWAERIVRATAAGGDRPLPTGRRSSTRRLAPLFAALAALLFFVDSLFGLQRAQGSGAPIHTRREER